MSSKDDDVPSENGPWAFKDDPRHYEKGPWILTNGIRPHQ